MKLKITVMTLFLVTGVCFGDDWFQYDMEKANRMQQIHNGFMFIQQQEAIRLQKQQLELQKAQSGLCEDSNDCSGSLVCVVKPGNKYGRCK